MGEWWTVFVSQLQADRRKAVALGVLALVLLCVVTHLLVNSAGSGPEYAIATAPTQPGPSAAAPIATFDSPAASPSIGTRSTRAAVSIGNLPRRMTRDLFQTDWSAFPPTAELLARQGRSRPADEPAGGFARMWREFKVKLASQQRSRARRQAEIEAEAAAFTLQGTVLGRPPLAFINGRWVRESDRIGEFTVGRVAAREVELHKSGHNVRLTMP
ncbi:MAG: hypothetical protein V3T70_10085 [Phycisphaerae bacterium]